MVGNPVLPCGFQQLLDESPRIVDVGRGRSQPDRAERVGGRPHRRPQRVFGVARARGGRATGAPGSEYTVQDSAHSSGSPPARRRRRSELGNQPDGGGGIVGVGDDDRLARGQGVALELCPGGEPAHIAGHGQKHIDRPAQRARAVRSGRRPANRGAQRLQQRHRPGVVHIGPRQAGVAGGDRIIRGDRLLWRPSDNASRTSSGAALPASQALAHTDSETLGHHMIPQCSCFARQRRITRILAACPPR